MKTLKSNKAKILFYIGMIMLTLTACKGKEGKVETSDVPEASQSAEVTFDKYPETIATVNGIDVPRKELERVYTMISFQAQMSGEPKSEEETIKTALTELVNAELLKQESIRKKIVPSKEAVDTELERMKSQFPDEETFKSEIGKQGLTMEDVRENVSTQLALREMLKTEIEDKIKISDEEINKFYTSNPDYFKTGESVKASHILIKSEEGDDEAKVAEAKKKIEAILSKVKGGADFAEMAKENSEGPSAPNGGDLGFFSAGQMVKPFEDAAFGLKKGDVSDIVKTRFGFHIIKVTDRKEAGMTPLADVRDKIEQYLLKMAGNEMLTEYLSRLRAAATIVQNI